MPYNLDDEVHVMAIPTHHDHARSEAGGFEFKPIGSKPKIPDWSPEHFDSYAATAESAARTAFGVIDNADCCGGGTIGGHAPWCRGISKRVRLHRRQTVGFHGRVARDHRSYLVASAALALGLAVMLGALLWLVPHRSWTAAPHVANNNPAWCLGFSGLSCKQDDK